MPSGPSEPGGGKADDADPVGWVRVETGLTTALRSVWVEHGGDVWIAGPSVIRTYDHTASLMQELAGPSDLELSDIYVAEDGIIYAAAGMVGTPPFSGIAKLDASSTWSRTDLFPICPGGPRRIAAFGSEMFAGCNYYYGFARGDAAGSYQESGWSVIVNDLIAVASNTDELRVYIVGGNGLYAYTGFELGNDAAEQWPVLFAPEVFQNAVWADSDGRVLLAGWDGVSYRGSVESQQQGLTATFETIDMPCQTTMRAMWGRSYDDVFAVGEGGAICHYDGTQWSVMESGTTADLYDVGGDASGNVWSVGADGVFLHLRR